MKNNLLKFGLLVLLAVFTFHSCSDDEQVISPKSVDSIKITIEDKIDNEELNNKIGQDLLKIRQAFQINTTNHKGENYQKKTENDSISIEDIEINIEAFNVIENENGKASYTFEVDFPLNNLDSQEIINLHFYYDENNQLKRQLIKYELSNEELQTVIENQSFDGFWDRISYSNLDDLETTPNSEKITAARSSDPCSCKSKKSTVKWKTPYSNNSGYGGYSSGTGGSGGQTPFSVIPISLQKLWGIAPASAYYPGPNYVGPTCNCNYTIPVRYFSVGDLTIPNTNSNSTPTPFNRRYFYYFPELKNKITTYYNQVYVSYINSYMTSTQTTLEDHNNKQRFITQFFKFLYKLRTENYSAFNYLANNPQKTVAVFNFLAENNSFNAYEFAKSAITALMEVGIANYSSNDYPGMDDGLPFEWWNDDEFVENNFSFNLAGEGFGDLTTQEKWLVAAFPARALIIYNNKELAETETINRFGNNGRNDKSDAFRHAFFNAMNSNDAGDTVARLFSNAHESEVTSNLILEVQMDLHNNNVGHTIGDDASIFISDQDLSSSVYQSLLNGLLVYLSPLDAVLPPNFGINSSTQIIPTN